MLKLWVEILILKRFNKLSGNQKLLTYIFSALVLKTLKF